MKEDHVLNFLASDYMKDLEGARSAKLDAAIKYALSYKQAFIKLSEIPHQAHDDALRLNEAMSEVNTEALALAKDTGSSMWILGSVCQMVKVNSLYFVCFF